MHNGGYRAAAGSGQDVERDVLAGGDREVQNAQAPQPVERSKEAPGAQLPQKAREPDGREYGKSHVQGRTGVA